MSWGIFWWSAGGWSGANRYILCLDFLLPWTWPCPKNMLFVTVVQLLSHAQLWTACPTHGLQHAGLPCPLLSSGVCSNSCPLSLWCHPTISSSVAPFPSCAQSSPALGSFPLSWLFASGSQSIGASASVTVLLMNIQDWFPLGLIGLISLQSSRLSRVFSSTTSWKHQFFSAHPSLWSNYHIWYMTTRKTIALTIQPFVSKVISLLFNWLSRFVIVFLPKSTCLLISWLQLPSTVILESKERKSDTASTFSSCICRSYGIGCHGLSSLNVEFQASFFFHSPLSPSSRYYLVPLHFLPLEWYHLHIWGYYANLSWEGGQSIVAYTKRNE